MQLYASCECIPLRLDRAHPLLDAWFGISDDRLCSNMHDLLQCIPSYS